MYEFVIGALVTIGIGLMLSLVNDVSADRATLKANSSIEQHCQEYGAFVINDTKYFCTKETTK